MTNLHRIGSGRGRLARLQGDPYGSLVRSLNPALYWRFEETSGTTAADSSPNGRNGTATGVTLGSTGLLTTGPGKCFDFGTSRVDTTFTPALGSFSAAALIYPSSVSGNRVIFGCVQWSPAIARWMLRMDNAGLNFYTNVDGSGGWVSLGAGNVMSVARFHVGVTYDAATVTKKIYLNGTQAATSTGSGAPVATLTRFSVGSWADTTNEVFAGKIDEVAYFSSVLSATDMANLAAAA